MIYKFNQIEIDSSKYCLFVDGKETSVEPQVFNLIVFLIENKDSVISRDEILDTIWKDRIVSDTSINNHIKSARKILGDDGIKQQVIKTIHSRGYQFIADIEIKAQDFTDTKIKPTKYYNLFYKSTIAILSIGILLLIYTKQNQLDDPPNIQVILRSVAVLPLVNLSNENENDFLGFALSDQIIGKLIYNRNIRVKSSTLVRKYNQSSLDPIAIGKELNVKYVLSGNYLKQNNVIRLNFELTNTESNELIWRESQELPYENLFKLQDTIANVFAQKLDMGLSSQEYFNNKNRQQISSEAYDFYLNSISYSYSKKDTILAIKLLNKALEIESKYAPIFLQLASRFRFLAVRGELYNVNIQKAQDYLIKALELNPRYLDALNALTRIYYDTGEFLKAYELANKMLIINPNQSDTYFSLGKIYRKSGMIEESINMFKKAQSFEDSTTINNQIGASLFSNSQYLEAKKYFDSETKNAPSLAWQGSIALRLGENKKAFEFFQKNAVLYPKSYWGNDGLIFMAIISGDKEKGLQELSLQEIKHVGVSEPSYFLASQYAAFGDKANAIRLFSRAVNEGYANLSMIRSDPFFDFLRQDEKYIETFNIAKKKHLAFKNAVAIDL